jgi:type I restriction enzyme, R subunit
MTVRGKSKFADYVLYYKPNIPIAIIEAKDNNHAVGDGMQQALEYAEILHIPFVFSSNGDGFVVHDRTGTLPELESALPLNGFPSAARLWSIYRGWKGLSPEQEEVVLQDYFDDGSGRQPRYYQRNAINAATEVIAKGQNRVLLVMATGTGKTYTAFQIIWRLWKAGRKKRVLYLADRNVLIDQTMVNDFRPFKGAMAKLSTASKTIAADDGTTAQKATALDRKRRIDTAYEIYLRRAHPQPAFPGAPRPELTSPPAPAPQAQSTQREPLLTAAPTRVWRAQPGSLRDSWEPHARAVCR